MIPFFGLLPMTLFMSNVVEFSLFDPTAVLPNTNSFFFLFPLYNLLILLPFSVLPLPAGPTQGLHTGVSSRLLFRHAFA